MTQRERLAAALHHAAVGCRWRGRKRVCTEDPSDMPHGADAAYLLDHGVRVVDDLKRFDQDERDAKAKTEFLKPIR